jgi:AcrR family transcriptional regulator
MAQVSAKNSDPERRAQVLKAAEKLLRHYGPAKTTIGDIAREAGIGVGSVYLEFCSKDEIVAELARRRHDRVLLAMRRAAEQGSFAARLAAALQARVVEMLELSREGAHSCDLVLCSAGAVKAAYGRFRAEELAFVAELLEAGSEAGEFHVSAPFETAELLQRAYATFSPPWVFEGERAQTLRLLEAMTQLVLRGLLMRADSELAAVAPQQRATRRRTRRE